MPSLKPQILSYLFSSGVTPTSTQPTLTETLTDPLGNGVVALDAEQDKFIRIIPYCSINGKVATYWVFDYLKRIRPDLGDTVWVPILISRFAVTSGTTDGIAGGLIGSSFWAGQISLTAGDPSTEQIASNNTNNPGEFRIDTLFSNRLKIFITSAEVTPGVWNALYQLYSIPPIARGV